MTYYSPLTLGTSAWLGRRDREGTDASPRAVLERVLDGIRSLAVVDTSNEYGGGFSEQLIGDVLRERGGVPDGVTIATKLDRDPATGDFSADRMVRSIEESLVRLGMSSVPLLYLHDPESISFRAAMAEGGPVRALEGMKADGLADRIGISGGPAPMLTNYVETGVFDAVITHNRFTLVDRSAEQLLDAAAQRGALVFNAAPYGSAPLAKWPDPVTHYAYRPAHPLVAESIDRMGEICARHGVSLAAAALQFSMRDPRITSTVVGLNTLAQLDRTLDTAALMIPESLFAELEAVRPAPVSWQEPPGDSPWNDPDHHEGPHND
ncbi:aldo/keto reductase [Marisediminicola sp. LYQ85]|uniref:aldo/keto reductase n=1 Tax=Marisediminicola sp. LYQ85 TaxID=3391062 RepID=UPI0039838776